MNKRKKIIRIAIVFILVLAILIVSFLAWEKKKENIQKEKARQEEAEKQENVKKEDAGNKKKKEELQKVEDSELIIYRNDEYGFEVKYPGDWDLIVMSSNPNMPEKKDSFVLRKEEHVYFAVFTNGGFGYGIKKPKKVTQESFNGKKVEMYWYDNNFPNFIYITSGIPKGWNNENTIEIRTENADKATLDVLQNMYRSFRFI